MVEEVPVTGDGRVDLGALEHRLAKAERPLVSVMLANNETGVIQPIAEIAAIVHAPAACCTSTRCRPPAASTAPSTAWVPTC